MSSHLHCPSCDHCTELHKLAPVKVLPFLPATGPNVLQCAACTPDDSTGTRLCPAGEKPDSISETLRLMQIQLMRHMISESGI